MWKPGRKGINISINRWTEITWCFMLSLGFRLTFFLLVLLTNKNSKIKKRSSTLCISFKRYNFCMYTLHRHISFKSNFTQILILIYSWSNFVIKQFFFKGISPEPFFPQWHSTFSSWSKHLFTTHLIYCVTIEHS